MPTVASAHFMQITTLLNGVQAAAGQVTKLQPYQVQVGGMAETLADPSVATLRRHLEGFQKVPVRQRDQVLDWVRHARDLSNPYFLDPTVQRYTPRDFQRYIANRFVSLIEQPDASGKLPKRGVFRADTGTGKSLTYAVTVAELRRTRPDHFRDAKVVIGSHRFETALGIAKHFKAYMPNDHVAVLSRGFTEEHLRHADVVAANYPMLSQSNTIAMLQEWAGKNRLIFILDEADMVVFKGNLQDPDDDGTPEDVGWDDSLENGEVALRDRRWFRPLIDFGLFNEDGSYNERTRHYLLGASATLDRPDGIRLASVWGKRNLFYHTPLASGILRGYLVPVIGKRVSMDLPENTDLTGWGRFIKQVTIHGEFFLQADVEAIRRESGSSYAVKTSARLGLDNLVMDVKKPDGSNGKATRLGIGYATDIETMKKAMKEQRDLFGLVEIVYQSNQILSNAQKSRRDKINDINRLLAPYADRGVSARLGLYRDLNRFLYSREWKALKSDLSTLTDETLNLDALQRLVGKLYATLNVQARASKGRPLTASAVWGNMDLEAVDGEWPNGFGDRERTMRDLQNPETGEIDFVWNVGILTRGVDMVRASLVVDMTVLNSRRELAQRLGRITRPPDGKNPKNHDNKPYSIYVSVLADLTAHNLDPSRMDLMRLFGIDDEAEIAEISPKTLDRSRHEKTGIPENLQLELSGTRTLNLLRVGRHTAEALRNVLLAHFGEEGQIGVEAAAFASGVDSDVLMHWLTSAELPGDWDDTLHPALQAWGCTEEEIQSMRGAYFSDRAAAQAVYGPAWRVENREALRQERAKGGGG